MNVTVLYLFRSTGCVLHVIGSCMLLDNKSKLGFKNMHVGNLWEAASRLKLIRLCFHQPGTIISIILHSQIQILDSFDNIRIPIAMANNQYIIIFACSSKFQKL